MRPERFFVVAGLAFGLILIFATPPFQVPDEPAHFYRAYAVSEGNLSAQRGADGLGAELPASLEELGAGFKAALAFQPDRRIAPETIRKALRVPLEPDRRRFTDFRTSAQFTPVSYLPQALGIAVARALGAPALGLLYAARVANLLAATALIALGLRRLPAYPWLLTMLALTPMAAFLRSSASADAPTTALAFLLAGMAARLAWGEGEPARWTDVALLAAVCAALCLTKPVYVTLAFLVLLIPAARLPQGRRAPVLLVVGFATAVSFLLAMRTAGTVDLPIRLDVRVDKDRQIAGALADPLRVVGILAENYLHMGRRYVAQIVGQLGWLDANLPKTLLWGYAALLGGLAVFDTRRTVEVSLRQRGLLALVTLATLGLVSASQYAYWTPYGADYVEGIQGRYFIPLAPAVAWMLHSRRDQAKRLDPIMPWLGLLTFCAATLWTVIRRYYLSS
jgi:uncharacterized membrane protein